MLNGNPVRGPLFGPISRCPIYTAKRARVSRCENLNIGNRSFHLTRQCSGCNLRISANHYHRETEHLPQ